MVEHPVGMIPSWNKEKKVYHRDGFCLGKEDWADVYERRKDEHLDRGKITRNEKFKKSKRL
jgi:hypothetical protein